MLPYSNKRSITNLIARLDRLEEFSFKNREEEVKAKISRFIDKKVAEWDRLHGDPTPEDHEELIKISSEIEEYKRAAWDEFFRTNTSKQ
jgi:hypothetical protein